MESGNIETTGETPSFVLPLSDGDVCMDYAGELDDLTLPLLAWLSENQPQMLLNPERNQDIKFSAVINDDDSADLLFTLPLRERVRIMRSSQGTPQAEHLPEPKPRLPSSEGDWSHVFQDVTWGESDG
ncbi:P2 phage tail completion R family protein [Escherichia coli Jurua 18/11]|nr:P2 phage tail completion R family protein [Escherichia coli Jurua 18/11]